MTVHEYYKTGHITAERFDGSEEMMRKYDIEVVNYPYGGLCVFISTLEGQLSIRKSDWIATGANGEHWPIADDIFHKTYAELPVIPQKVADYIQKAKAGTWGIIDCYYHVADNVTACGLDGVRDWEYWIVDHQDAFARAWLDGYRIEEENDDQF